MSGQKERLIVFLGAGASVRAGVPSTWDVTEWVRKYPLTGTSTVTTRLGGIYGLADVLPKMPDRPIFETIYRLLQCRFSQPNFEHMLALLEELAGLASSNLTNEISDDFAHVLAPLVVIDDRFPMLKDANFLREARSHFIKCVVTKFNNAYKVNADKDTEQFLSALRERYLLSVFTLNYDDLVERADPDSWFDGFTTPEGTPSHHAFNRREFVANILADKDLLCHMHGSTYYGYSDEHFDLVKFHTTSEAAKSLDWGKSDKLAKGDTFTRSPIITGFSKAAKLTYTPIPYGHYFRAFSDTLMACRKMVVIGYGGYDDHISAWFDEFIALHPDRRVVYVTPRRGTSIGEHSKLADLLQGFSGPPGGQDVVHSQTAYYDANTNPVEFHTLQNLALCAAGFPLADFTSTMPQILDFLDK